MVGNEVGEEVGTGEGLGLVGGGLAPGRWVVGEDKVIIVGESEVNFKNAVTEGVIEQEGVGGVGVGFAVDAAEGVGDVGMLGPRVVKLVGGGGERRVGRSRVIYWGGVTIWKMRKMPRLSSTRMAQMIAMRAGRERWGFDMA